MPNSEHRNQNGGGQAGSKSCESGGTEQSSLLETRTITSRALSRKKPAFPAGGEMFMVGSPSVARTAAHGCPNMQPDVPTCAMQPKTSVRLPKKLFRVPFESDSMK